MADFSDYPKQWVISRHSPGAAVAGRSDRFAGWHIQTAASVPIHRLSDRKGREIGRLLGWVIAGETFHTTDAVLQVPPGDSIEEFFAYLGGRFVMLWTAPDGRLLLREDASGNLPAVVAPEAEAVASTVSMLETVIPLEPDTEVNAIFAFPERRGFLPFGLTSREGAWRLMPNRVLDLADFSARRVWPGAEFCARPPLTRADARAFAQEAGEIVRRHMRAILTQGETVLYLSGGYDSRMILAACRGRTGNLRCETFGTAETLDVHVAEKVARIAEVPHRAVPILASSHAQLAAWLHRTGYTMYDPVSELVATVLANLPATHPLSGTGGELARASNWAEEDVKAPKLDLDTLLARIRMPHHPRIRTTGAAWLDELPPADAAMALDIAKIEQIHGCWSGAAIYGHPVSLPSLNPFSSQRLNEIALSLPKETRKTDQFYRDFISGLWPELLEVPVNRATGAARRKFWKQEVKRLVPDSVKRQLKPLR